MWELDLKEGWMLKNQCSWILVLEKTLESSLDSKEIKPVNPKGNQSWIFIGRTDAEAEAPILWPPDAKSPLIRKDTNTRKDWRQEKEMTGWDGWMASPTEWTWVWVNSRRWWRTGSLVCCSWGCKESDTTEWLNNSKYGKMQASRLAELIPFMCPSAICDQSCFAVYLASCIPQFLSSRCGGQQH